MTCPRFALQPLVLPRILVPNSYSFLALQTFAGELVNPFDQTTTSLDFAKSGPKLEEKIVKPSNLSVILIETWMTNRY
jgi:hypothetical protein